MKNFESVSTKKSLESPSPSKKHNGVIFEEDAHSIVISEEDEVDRKGRQLSDAILNWFK